MVVDAVEGVGDEGGGVGDDEDVADKLGPGDGSLEEISDGGTEDEDEDDEEGQDGSLDIEYERSTVSASNSVSNRLKSSSE
jgi:Ran GTPase-activating protein (RanGAP) involved in mRNA processing and transport